MDPFYSSKKGCIIFLSLNIMLGSRLGYVTGRGCADFSSYEECQMPDHKYHCCEQLDNTGTLVTVRDCFLPITIKPGYTCNIQNGSLIAVPCQAGKHNYYDIPSNEINKCIPHMECGNLGPHFIKDGEDKADRPRRCICEKGYKLDGRSYCDEIDPNIQNCKCKPVAETGTKRNNQVSKGVTHTTTRKVPTIPSTANTEEITKEIPVPNKDTGLNVGQTVAIVLGSMAGCIGLTAVIIIWCRCNKRKNRMLDVEERQEENVPLPIQVHDDNQCRDAQNADAFRDDTEDNRLE